MRLGPTGLIEVVSPFDAVTQAQLRSVQPAGRWIQRRGCWEFPLEAAFALQQRLSGRFPATPELARWLTWLRQPLPPLPSHGALVEAANLKARLPDGRCLFRHQRLAVRWLLARRGGILADGMGLGKTLSALAAARAMVRLANCRVVVLAPAALTPHWQREAASLNLALELHSWARLPMELPEAGTVLIADEAHFAQSIKALRTQAFLRLARHPRLRAIWLLSGTPMKNGRPVELLPLLTAIGHPLSRDQRAFEQRYCLGHWRERGGRKIWVAQGATHLEELRRLLGPLVLHRSKRQCLELPPKYRCLREVCLNGAAARGFEHQLRCRVEEYRFRASCGDVRPEAEALAALTALRQIGSHYKLPATHHLVSTLVRQQEAAVVFTTFRSSANLLFQRLGGDKAALLITGAQPAARRQCDVDRFQDGQRQLLVATFGAIGLGFSLHRAHHVVLIERLWTPGDTEQAEDRCHRIGMGAALICHWMQLGASDKLVDDVIRSKTERIHQVFERPRNGVDSEAMAQLARRMLEQL